MSGKLRSGAPRGEADGPVGPQGSEGERAPKWSDMRATSDAAQRRLEEVRALLIPVEWERVDVLEKRVDDFSVESQDVGRVLPEAIVLCREDERLAHALKPTIEGAIEDSVRSDPQVLVDAIFPVIGPAIRKAVASSLRGMTENLNQLLEQSLSVRALRWRFEARRSGVPFAELLLLKTLVYRVEQVFLVHQETGMCVLQAAPRALGLPDADTLTGMLVAIGDFMRTSFAEGDDSDDAELHATQMSNRTLWVERGPHAALAVVIRGNPPQALRDVVRNALERVHATSGARLAVWKGDPDPVLESAQPYLEECLQASFVQKKKSARGQLILAFVLLIALAWPLLSFFDSLGRERLREAWWRTYQQAPGFVVTEMQATADGWLIQGLRDPLAHEPEPMPPANDAAVDAIEFDWHPYASLDAEMVLERVRRAVELPADAELTFAAGRLSVRSAITGTWVDRLAEYGPWIPGVDVVDFQSVGALEGGE